MKVDSEMIAMATPTEVVAGVNPSVRETAVSSRNIPTERWLVDV